MLQVFPPRTEAVYIGATVKPSLGELLGLQFILIYKDLQWFVS